jgi:hypothetical protein
VYWVIGRAVALKLIIQIEGARSAELKQYILITPQDMGGITLEGKNSKIIRLADPARDQ